MFRLGKKWDDETKKKISQNKKGNQPWNKGLSLSVESKIKMSLAKKGKNTKGENSNAKKVLGSFITKNKDKFDLVLKTQQENFVPRGRARKLFHLLLPISQTRASIQITITPSPLLKSPPQNG